MKKTKEYPHTRFPPEVLRKAREKIESWAEEQSGNSSALQASIQIDEQEKWQFDNEDDFFPHYRKEHSYSYYDVTVGNMHLTIEVYRHTTRIAVQAGARSKIESVFSIFEDASSTSRCLDEKQPQSIFSRQPGFSTERKLSSLNVDKNLLLRLEDYFLEEIPRIAKLKPEEARRNYKITSADHAGVQQFRSIREYSGDVFPDTISRVVLNSGFIASDDASVNVKLSLDTEPHWSSVQVDVTSANNPRELCHAVLQGLLDRLEPNKNLHRLLHPSFPLTGILYGLSAPSGMAALTLAGKGLYLPACLAAVPPTILFLLWIGGKANPYTAFKTQANDRWSDLWKWFCLGLLGFLLFGTGAFYLRKALLGY